MRTVCVANSKGGVGKTTTTVTLGHALAIRELRVLLVDADAQGNVSSHLGLEPAGGLYKVIVEGQDVERLVVKAREGLWVLPGDKSTARAKEIMTSYSFREQVLVKTLEPVRDLYDVALIDCAPSLDVLNVAALVAADDLLIPVAVDYLATVGLAQHVETVAELRRAGHDATLRWVVPTFFDELTRESRAILGELAEHFGGLVTVPIHRNVKLREAPAYLWSSARPLA